jgi:transcriptional regulator with XRE-family HTH domain
MPNDSFGSILGRFRTARRLTQEELSDEKLHLSPSYIAMLEREARPKREGRSLLSRQQLWYLIEKLSIWPPELDQFLEAAGHSAERTEEEELLIQRRFDLKELWVFARIIRDPDRDWYDVVRDNIFRKRVVYRYFTEDPTAFELLRRKLEHDSRRNPRILVDRLECIRLPGQLFITNLAIYNPGRPDMYCCGTKSEHGKAHRFYTMYSSESFRLFELLSAWRTRIYLGQEIRLAKATIVFPLQRKVSHTPFVSDTP